MISISVNERKWRFAYRFEMGLALLFLIFSLLMHVGGVESNQVSALGAGIYFLGAMYVFLLMVTSGGVLAPIAWYVLGSGIFFGLGSALWGLLPGLYPRVDLGVLPGDLLEINLLNSGSIVVVLMAARLSLGKRLPAARLAVKPRISLRSIYSVLMIVTLLLVLIEYYFFPVAENFLVRSVQAKAKYIIWMALLVTGALWHELRGHLRLLGGIIVVLVLVKAILTFSKTDVLYPLICMAAGYWLTNRESTKVIIPMIAFLTLFSMVLVPYVQQGRSANSYDAASNSLGDRLAILGSGLSSSSSESWGSFLPPLRRVAHGPYQRYLINEYQMGKAGSSLADFWVALVPRVLWPAKPNVTRFGTELYDQYNRMTGARSALAPTYSAEAYWNYGVLGVLAISALLGLQFGWLTKCWFRSIRGRSSSYLIIAVPAAFSALSVESWTAATHFGGFITLIVIWVVAAVIIQNIGGRNSSRLQHTVSS